MIKKINILLIFVIVITFFLCIVCFVQQYSPSNSIENINVESLYERMYQSVGDTGFQAISDEELMGIIKKQIDFGPRHPSAPGHEKLISYIVSEMNNAGLIVKKQNWKHKNTDGTETEFTNIIASFCSECKDKIILGAHYDSKHYANFDENDKFAPVPGANDSASGVAVLIGIAKVLSEADEQPSAGVDFIFFDGEEGEEEINGANNDVDIHWRPLGSIYFTENITDVYKNELPVSGVVVDMVCDKNLQLPIEKNSWTKAQKETGLLWSIAQEKYSDIFVLDFGTYIFDDHIALNDVGIPTVLIIDFDYPYFHTTDDTLDKCSGDSLNVVAESILVFLYSY